MFGRETEGFTEVSRWNVLGVCGGGGESRLPATGPNEKCTLTPEASVQSALALVHYGQRECVVS